MSQQRAVSALVILLASGIAAACASSGGLPAILQKPDDKAVTMHFGVPPDSVIMVAWESLRADGVLARRFQRAAEDTTGRAFMESDWVYVPRVMPTAPLTGLSEPEKWVKFLFWAYPDRGGTRLFAEGVYNPTQLPSEPTNWSLVILVPDAVPAWQYVENRLEDINRRLNEP